MLSPMNFGVMPGTKAIRDGHGIERNCGIIPSWHSGRRTDESCSWLMNKLSVFPIKNYYTDNWGVTADTFLPGKKKKPEFQNIYQETEP